MNNQPSRLRQTESKYCDLELVGQGQFGRVFRATHKISGQIVALKELETNRFPTAKFLRELHFLISLQHPNVVTFQGLEHTSTGRYLVMDYCDGGSLRNLMNREGKLSLALSLKLVINILAGLEHIHSRKIIHRDIKPENILLSQDTTGLIARVADFGMSKINYELSTDKQDDCAGSPAYMAPERFYGQYSPASDLYAVGIILFELIVGLRPFSGLPGELLKAHINQAVVIPEAVPFLLRSTITKAMQKLPSNRFSSATEMLKSVQLAAQIEDASSNIVPPSESVFEFSFFGV
ncbi:serine/threonine-protein kinase [Chlorogloea sp. CCALA 695]|uniref:serine/threonine-protein kinase n=1 Tax=Chlorogloea sp. CCALA 695 TaxID=2107693 RepID=UPI000D06BE21|nr:serine/threonine-protein kinase [Chlorogloea sp. CCALA 695]PSB32891.1 serine/threonine protein kinase [Chlorogloea sp. CCALA 695]